MSNMKDIKNWFIPNVVFRVREGDKHEDGGCSFGEGGWINKTTDDYFKGKRVVLFSLPGAFTPVCSSVQLPDYESKYQEFKNKGIDEVYCLSVNDSFTMNAWFDQWKIKNVKPIADGNGHFTRRMGMLVNKTHLGFGMRAWRYAFIVENGQIIKWFEEEGINDQGKDEDPFVATAPENILKSL